MISTRSTSTYVLIPGAGGSAWYWHRVVHELASRGIESIAIELPAGDAAAGLVEYTDAVLDAVGGRRDVIVVAQSMGGFTGVSVCSRIAVRQLVFVNAMIPRIGESPGEWWAATGQRAAQVAYARELARPTEFDFVEDFFHDVPADIRAEAMRRGAPPQSETPFAQRLELAAWPRVPMKVITGIDDRLFPVDFQVRVATERLGVAPDLLPGGHLIALAHPVELVDRLERIAP